MAYSTAKFPTLVLKHPKLAALLVLIVGCGGGVLAEWLGFSGLFERFGALNIALGVLLFGSLASELLVRAQGTFILGNDGEPREPFKFKQVRSALNWQTFVVVLGTVQWGFGGLLFRASCEVSC